VGRSDSRRRRGKRGRRSRRRNRAHGWSGPGSELEPSPASRIVAEFVDWLVFIGLCGITAGIALVVGVPSWGIWVLVLVVAPVLLTIYEIVAIAAWGTTVGKRFAGLRVLRAGTLETPGWKRAAIRTLGLAPWSWIPRYLQRHAFRGAHGLHDRLAGTVVVDDRAWQRRNPRRGDDTDLTTRT
jgi:uncharacterized RDD family membrane protein YckC